ncbi:uncharacterized protein Z519_03866 [Cladophialophora bantiana CBS 173.52]|uniref:Heterokaryon incompatibility domain-containing protein n=1 Tax=Cladophialophora bantiana (strain ATCC 10958 / CBS 173.52 / CDC B-1940 / NIH 8579) TaxID=1442370 RepID=A0A0D2G9H1_CLAB1|nr:uncharacterized protein Z519_03866 [Cladophialophora bantiana CBS 173.52]KIW95282.1 hypothetical protein Z519_03866 [Cladophialophora bantiana CBS 173.52]
MRPSNLCEKCRRLFEGPNQPPEIDRVPFEHIDALSDDENQASDEDLVSISGDSQPEDRDRRPKLPPRVSRSSTSRILVHHNMAALVLAAASGCHLCNLLSQRLPQDTAILEWANKEHRRLLEEHSPHLNGVITIDRLPEENISDALDLRLSYYINENGAPVHVYGPIGLQWYYLGIENDVAVAVRSRTLVDVKKWISDCQQNHDECRQLASLSSTVKPARLVEIIDGPASTRLRIVEGQTLPPDISYATLSHCWGTTRMAVLRHSNEAEFAQNIPLAKLTKTFQDAVTYTRELGLHYLWIDAFCINQDSFGDWLDQALAMASIYANACINIAATASPNGDGGLFLARNEYLANPCIVKAKWNELLAGEYVIYDRYAWYFGIERSVLSRRAWVLQERLLSRRTIHFAADQVSWECARVRANETWPKGVPEDPLTVKTRALSALASAARPNHADLSRIDQHWLTAINTYSGCDLTKDSDKLVALAGYAQVTQDAFGCLASDYAAGMWKAYLPEDLLWHAEPHSTRYEKYHAPSWSWASVKGTVSWNPEGARSIPNKDLACSVLQIDISLVDATKPLGPVSAASIELCGPLCPVNFGPGFGTRAPRLQYIDVGQRRFGRGFLAEYLDDGSMYHSPGETLAGFVIYFGRFATLPFLDEGRRHSIGLLLARTSVLPPGVFKRIGYAKFFHRETSTSFEQMCYPALDLSSDAYLGKVEDGRYVFRIV